MRGHGVVTLTQAPAEHREGRASWQLQEEPTWQPVSMLVMLTAHVERSRRHLGRRRGGRSAADRRRTIFKATESVTTISIYGPDAAERIEGLRAVISHFVVKHGWTLHGSTPEAHDTDPEAKRIKAVLGTHVATESWRESPNVGKRRLPEQRSSNQIGRPRPNAEIL